jgi:WD40 repeat protein
MTNKLLNLLVATVTFTLFGMHASAQTLDAPTSVNGAEPKNPASSMSEIFPVNSHATQPQLRTRINIGSFLSKFYVVRLAFSPDSRYLAIGDAGSANIVIWDLQLNKEHTRFKVAQHDDSRRGGSNILHWNQYEDILWSPDGRFVTTGIGRAEGHGDDPLLPIELWDPMTGKLAYALDTYSIRTGSFNHDGSKLMNVADGWSGFSIYDTHSWNGNVGWGKTFWHNTGLNAGGYAWTDSDKVLAVGTWTGRRNDLHIVQLTNGQEPELGAIVAVLVDPTNRSKDLAVVLDQPLYIKTDNDPTKPLGVPYLCKGIITHFATKRAAIRCDGAQGVGTTVRMIDTETLRTIFIHHEPQSSLVENGRFGIAFSADGKYLYLLAHVENDTNVDSVILDAATGEKVGTFPSGESWGLAISPDGKAMAAGHRGAIELFDLK